MIGSIKKDLTIDFITSRGSGKCDGCIVRHGASFADVSQVIYLTASWNEKDYTQMEILKPNKESYCYHCAMNLFDNWRDMMRNAYQKKHLEKINNIR